MTENVQPKKRLPFGGIDLRYYLRGGGLLSVDYLVTMVFGLLTAYCFANFTTKQIYGSYTYIQSILGVLVLFSLPGMNNAVLRSASRNFDGALLKGVMLRLRFSLLGSVALWIIAIILYKMGMAEKATAAIWISILFPGLYSFLDFRPYLQGKQWFGKYVLYGALATTISSGSTICVILLGYGFLPILITNVLARVLGNGLFILILIPKLRNDKVDEDFIPFARNLSLLAVLGSFVMQVDKIVIGTMLDDVVLAVYKIALTLTEPIRTMGVFLNRLTFPRMAKASGQTVYKRFKSRLFLVILAAGGLGLVSYILIPPVIRMFFPQYLESIALVGWMVCSSCVAVVLIYLDTFYISQDRLHRVYYANNVVRMILTIALMIALARPFGPLGVIWGRLAVRSASVVYLMGRLWSGVDKPGDDHEIISSDVESGEPLV